MALQQTSYRGCLLGLAVGHIDKELEMREIRPDRIGVSLL